SPSALTLFLNKELKSLVPWLMCRITNRRVHCADKDDCTGALYSSTYARLCPDYTSLCAVILGERQTEKKDIGQKCVSVCALNLYMPACNKMVRSACCFYFISSPSTPASPQFSFDTSYMRNLMFSSFVLRILAASLVNTL